MILARALAHDCNPAPASGVGLAASLPTLRSLAAALLFAPLLALAQQPDTAPAPAAQETADTPRRPGETTTGRPLAPAVPAPAMTPPAVTTPAAPAATAPLSPAPRVALPASTPTASATSPGAAGLLQTILALMLVLGLLAGLAWAMKRFGPRMGGGSANLRVVSALNLGGRERIMVVEVGDQWIVVGAAPGRVNALHTMPRQEGEFTTTGAQGGMVGANPGANFSDWLKKTIDKRNAR